MRLHECRSADQARWWQHPVSSPPTGEGARAWIVASGVVLGNRLAQHGFQHSLG